MAATFTWTISSLDTAPLENKLVDVIKTVHWRYTCTDGDCATESYGTVSLNSPEPKNYIKYDSLTKETVVGWVECQLDVTEMQTRLLATLAAIKTPTVVSRTPNF